MKRTLVALTLFLLMASLSQGQTCDYYSHAILGFNNNLLDAKEHTAPAGHGLENTTYGECSYDDAFYGPDICSSSCYIDLKRFAEPFETSSTLFTYLVRHTVAADEGSGTSYNPAGSSSCSALQGVEVVSCSRLALLCSATVSIGFGGVGITFGPNALWKNSGNPSVITCPGRRGYNGTPILIDTDGSGFHLSSSLKGVPFNFFGTGLLMTAWPLPGSTNGFLVLPDADGMVPTGKQMFGNQTGFANGFDQLAQYDDNHDGEIDNQDPIYDQLYVWIDANRDGISQPNELQPFRNIVESISLNYKVSKYVDDNGNAIRYRSTLKLVGGNRVERVVDAILSFGMPVAN